MRLRHLVAATLAVVLLASPAHALTARERLLALTNEDRVEHDRRELRLSGRVSRYAELHSRAMMLAGTLFHSTKEQLRVALEGVRWTVAGENVGVGESLRSLQRAFMSSREHRRNVLRRAFRKVGIGVVRDDDERLWVTVVFFG